MASRVPMVAKPRKVRCLGPGAEHSFLSEDPVNHRICSRCRELKSVLSPAPILKFAQDGLDGRVIRKPIGRQE